MRISTARNHFDNRPQTVELTWAELCEKLRHPVVTACTVENCKSLDPTLKGKCEYRDVGMWGPVTFDGGGKSQGNVTSLEALSFDVDNVALAELEAIDGAVQREGLACLLLSSHSNNQAQNDFSVRVILPLSEPILFKGRSEAVRNFRAYWAQRLSISPDRATKDENRLYYLPSMPTGAKFLYGLTVGQAVPSSLEVPSILGGGASRGGAVGLEGPSASPSVFADVDLDETRQRWIRDSGKEIRPLVVKVCKGEQLAEEGKGERYPTVLRLTASCKSVLWDVPNASLVELFRASVSHWSPRENVDKLSWLELVESQIDYLHIKDAPTREAKTKALEDTLKNGGMTFDEMRGAVIGGGMRPSSNPVQLERQIAVVKSQQDKYTAEQLAEWKEELGVNDAEFAKRWVIRTGGASWVFENGRYGHPVKDNDLPYHVMQAMNRSGIRLWNEGAKGELTARPFQDILIHHSSVAAGGIRGELALQKSYYDMVTRSFHEAVCPIRDLEPTYDPEVDEWLHMFGELKVLDWVAGVTLLERVCSSLYIFGERGIGKSLLAHGLARLWRPGGPSEFENVVGGTFNSSLAECPLVFADEGFPANMKDIVERLRRFLGSSSFDLNRKYMPTVNVSGHPRLIVAANNGRLLQTTTVLEEADVEAMGQRVLQVHVKGNRPAAFLQGLKDSKGVSHVKNWIDRDVIAKHALWMLGQNDTVKNSTARFLVEGDSNAARMLTTQSGDVPIVLEFLARYLSADKRMAPDSQQILTGGGRLLVRAELISNSMMFDQFGPEKRCPSAIRASQALKQISTGEAVEVNDVTYQNVKVDVVLDWVRDIQVGNVKTIKERVGV